MSNAETHFPPLTSAVKGQRQHAAVRLLLESSHTLRLVCRRGADLAAAAFQKAFRDGSAEADAPPAGASAARMDNARMPERRHGSSEGNAERVAPRVTRCALHDDEPAVPGAGLCAYHLAQKLKYQRGDKAGAWPNVAP